MIMDCVRTAGLRLGTRRSMTLRFGHGKRKTKMKKIIFNLKRMWPVDGVMRDLYEMIKSGEKTTEYRDMTKHWADKLRPAIQLEGYRAWFVVGYPKGSLPRLEADITEIDVQDGQYHIHFENVVEVLQNPVDEDLVPGKHPDAETKIHVPEEFKPLLEDLRLLSFDGDNPNRMSKQKTEALWRSLERFGWFKPILVDGDAVLGDGQHRVEVCIERGEYYAPVLRLKDLDDSGRRLLRQVANKLRGSHQEDLDQLEYKRIAEAGDQDSLIKILQLGEKELREALEHEAAPLVDEYKIPALEDVETDIELGDKWLLGEHVLVCGNSGHSSHVNYLMMDELLDCVVTDPPYGVSYREDYMNAPIKGTDDAIQNDGDLEVYQAFIRQLRGLLKPEGPSYMFYSAPDEGVKECLESYGYRVRCQLIWLKKTAHPSFRQNWRQKHEPLYYVVDQEVPSKWYGSRKATTILEYDRPRYEKLHPTMKPVDLYGELITYSTMPDELVGDFFGGSGTMLIAAEKTGRRARVMELDPRYCQIMIDRWEAYTGQEAVQA